MITNDIKIREKLDLYLGKGPYYRTVAEDISEDNTLLVSIPTFRGIPIILRPGQEVNLYFYRENGRYVIKARVVGFELSGQIRLARLFALSAPERQQRRESFRISAMLRTILRPYYLGPFPYKPVPEEEQEMEEAPTFNLSATGVAVRTTREYQPGERLYLRIFLSWPQPKSAPLEITGEIKQVVKTDNVKNIFQLGIMFIDASEDMASHITKFVLMEEQRQRKQTLPYGRE